MFRNLIFLAMAVGAASMAGWFSINREGDQTSIQFNRAEIRSDAGKLIDRGREYLDEREQRLASQRQSQSNYGDDGYGQPTYQQQSYQQQTYPQQSYQQPNYDNGQYQYRADQYDQPRYDQPQYRETDYGQGGQVYRDDYYDSSTEARGGVRYGVPYQNERTR